MRWLAGSRENRCNAPPKVVPPADAAEKSACRPNWVPTGNVTAPAARPAKPGAGSVNTPASNSNLPLKVETAGSSWATAAPASTFPGAAITP